MPTLPGNTAAVLAAIGLTCLAFAALAFICDHWRGGDPDLREAAERGGWDPDDPFSDRHLPWGL